MYQDLTGIPVIDTHVHVFPKKLFDAVRHWFEKHAWHFTYGGAAGDLIRAQFDNGAAGLVLLCYAHRPRMARELNGFVAGLCERFPHTAGLGTVHPGDQDPRGIIKEAMEGMGLCGIKLHCHVLKIAADDPVLFSIYEAIQKLGGILNIHAGKEPAIKAYGMDVRDITGARRVENVLKRYPEMKVIIPHMGFDESDRFYSLLEIYPNLHLDTTMVMSGYFPIPIDREKVITHADRILCGSDYPHIPYDMEEEVKGILKMGLGEGPTRKILYENAVRLFQITPKLLQT